MSDATLVTKKLLTCHVHPKYKAIRKPRSSCVLCRAMWHDKLVEQERLKKIEDANKAAYHGDIDGDFNYW